MSCELSLKQIIEATQGELISQASKSFFGVMTDTRKPEQGQIFVALKGENHDGHKHLAQAYEKGAKALLIHEESEATESLKGKITIVKVKDTLKGLQDLAQFWRKEFKAKVVAITGSNGKTTTKEFTSAILGKQFKVRASQGSFNNHWGVPFSLLAVSKFDEVAIVEMGMNHPGELTRLCEIACPDIVLCTTVARAHIGKFGGSIEAIAEAKEEIYISSPQATQIFNYDNEYTHEMFERATKKIDTNQIRAFSSFSAGAEVSMRATSMQLDGLKVVGHIGGIKGDAFVPIFGRHNVVNLMASSSIALALGMEPELIWSALPSCRSQWGRSQLLSMPSGTKVIFDAYNANPDSMAVLIKNIFEISVEGKKVAVLGEMFELGSEAKKAHFELGEMVGNTDFDTVWFLGPSKGDFEAGIKASGSNKNLMISDSYEESLAKKLQDVLNPQDIVVVKGSRGVKLEKVLAAWSLDLVVN